MFTILIQFGWVGLGYSRGLVPELRCGVFTLAWCRGALLARMREWQAALERARIAMGGQP